MAESKKDSSSLIPTSTKEDGGSSTSNIRKLMNRIDFNHFWNISDNSNNPTTTSTASGVDTNDTNAVHVEYTVKIKLTLDSQELQLLKESIEALVLMKHIEMTDLFIITFGQMLHCVDGNNDTTDSTNTNSNSLTSIKSSVGYRRFQSLLEKEAANYISAAEKEAAKYNITLADAEGIVGTSAKAAEIRMLQIKQVLRSSDDENNNKNCDITTNDNPTVCLEELESASPLLDQNEVETGDDTSIRTTPTSNNEEMIEQQTIAMLQLMEDATIQSGKAVESIEKTSTNIYNQVIESCPSKSDVVGIMDGLIRRSIFWDKIKIFILLYILLFLIFIQPILICIKVEHELPSSTSWGLVFIPFWIFATMQMLFLLGWWYRSIKIQESTEQQWYNFLTVVKFGCIVCSVLLLSLKLDQVIDWSYVIVLCPVYVYECFWFVESFIDYMQHRQNALENAAYVLLKVVLHSLFLGFVIVKLDDLYAEWSWWLVFVPIWIGTFLLLLDSLCILCRSSSEKRNQQEVNDDGLTQPLLDENRPQVEASEDVIQMDNTLLHSSSMEDIVELKSTQSSEQNSSSQSENHVDIAVDFLNDGFHHYSSLGSALLTCCGLFFGIIVICLFVGRLDTDGDGDKSYSSFWILFPFFFLAGLLLCCCSCVLWCLPNEVPDETAIHSLYDEAQDTTTHLKDQIHRTINEVTA